MTRVLAFLIFLLLPAAALAQGQQCRTSPVGASTAYCASEAFVTESLAAGVTGPASAVAGDLASFADSSGKVLADSGLLSTAIVTSVDTGGLATGGPATGAVTVTVTAASKSDEQAATSATLATTPLHQQDHDSAAKAWCIFNGTTTGTNACITSYNVTSIKRNSAGNYTAAFTVAFAAGSPSPSYGCTVTPMDNTGAYTGQGFASTSQLAASWQFLSLAAGAPTDITREYIECHGRQ